MKKQLVLSILLFCCFSCASQKREIATKSTIKLEGRNTNIRDLLEIDGYYQNTYYSKIMLFEDGLYVDQFHFKIDLSESEITTNLSKSIQSGTRNKQDTWGFWWGAYKIVEDTIVVYKYLRGSFWTPWYFDEVRYKIIDRTTILPIYSRGLLKIDEQYYKNKNPWQNGDRYYFTPADSLPSSDCWLKEEKWIWRNERDWENYMERIKQGKKK